LSILGFDIKPLYPRFQGIIEELTRGFPYDVLTQDWNSRFWPNMSVRYLFSNKRIHPPQSSERGTVGRHHTYELNDSLPRFYFQNQWSIGSDEEQRSALMNLDLRKSGWCDQTVWERRPLPDSFPESDNFPGDKRIVEFKRLQEKNIVTDLNLTSPNRLELEVHAAIPAMLVVTDIWQDNWRATVDGEEVPLLWVNYLQRGVWSFPGRHRIMMEVMPGSLNTGLWMTVMGVLLLIGLAGLAWRNRKNVKIRSDK